MASWYFTNFLTSERDLPHRHRPSPQDIPLAPPPKRLPGDVRTQMRVTPLLTRLCIAAHHPLNDVQARHHQTRRSRAGIAANRAVCRPKNANPIVNQIINGLLASPTSRVSCYLDQGYIDSSSAAATKGFERS